MGGNEDLGHLIKWGVSHPATYSWIYQLEDICKYVYIHIPIVQKFTLNMWNTSAVCDRNRLSVFTLQLVTLDFVCLNNSLLPTKPEDAWPSHSLKTS